jgi:hypothetical protein
MKRREASLLGTPSYFRACVADASRQEVLATNLDSGRAVRATYAHPGWHLAIHLDEYLTDEAREELDRLGEGCQHLKGFLEELEQFLEREFPGCMALVPKARRGRFMRGMAVAIEDERLVVRHLAII